MNIILQRRKKRISVKIEKGMRKTFPEKGRQRHLADSLGVSAATVSGWIHERGTPSIEQLSAMAKIFGVPLHSLCGYSGKRPVRTESAAFNNVMNLSIVMERVKAGGNGGDRATCGITEKVRRTLEGIRKA